MTLKCPTDPKHSRVYQAAGTGEIVCVDCLRSNARRRNKFGAVRVENVHGKFDSRKEAGRYAQLVEMEQRGVISDLQKHPRFELKAWSPTGPVTIGHYTADAQYRPGDERMVVEDTKSKITKTKADYRLRKKLFEANYPHIEHREY